jgi:hypothetical protein
VEHEQITLSGKNVTFLIFGVFFQYDTLGLAYSIIIYEHMFQIGHGMNMVKIITIIIGW